jgi:hypothetical protein
MATYECLYNKLGHAIDVFNAVIIILTQMNRLGDWPLDIVNLHFGLEVRCGSSHSRWQLS